jgi:hypothetical protein
LQTYNLWEDFNFDSIENLIPTSKTYNRLNGKIILDERYFLAIAKGKKERVEKELAAVNKRRVLYYCKYTLIGSGIL